MYQKLGMSGEKMKPILCISIMESTKEEILQLAEEMTKTPADMVEWRIDFFRERNKLERLKECLTEMRKILKNKQLILTLRIKKEGGSQIWNGVNLNHYLDFLVENTQLYDGVDLEMSTIEMIPRKEKEVFIGKLKVNQKLLIGSYHDFQGMEDESTILNRCKEMGKSAVDIVKVAYSPKTIAEVENFIKISQKVELPEKTKKVMIAMSELGRNLRIRPEITGSVIAYCSYQKEINLGQISMEEYLRNREN